MQNGDEASGVPSHSNDPNPFGTPGTPSSQPVEAVEKRRASIGQPRLWTVGTVFLCSFATMILFQIIAVVLYLIPNIVEIVQTQGSPDGLERAMPQLSSPLGFIMLALPGQLGLLFVVYVAARLSPARSAERLGFVDSRLTWFQWLATGVATVIPAAIGLGLATALALVIEADESVAEMYEKMNCGIAIPFILFISLVPGFAEEMLYRGYMQRRLLKRWSPVWAILTTSLLFALSHVTPHAIVFTFPVGLWLGYVSWKTNSIWPTVLGHAFINGIWNVLNISKVLLGYSETIYYSFCGILVFVGMVCLLIAWPAIHHRSSMTT